MRADPTTIHTRVASAVGVVLLCAATVCAQPGSQKSGTLRVSSREGAPRVPQFVSPEVKVDRSVIFHLYAPQAQAVRVTGSDIPGNVPAAAMTKGENGVWEATLAGI